MRLISPHPNLEKLSSHQTLLPRFKSQLLFGFLIDSNKFRVRGLVGQVTQGVVICNSPVFFLGAFSGLGCFCMISVLEIVYSVFFVFPWPFVPYKILAFRKKKNQEQLRICLQRVWDCLFVYFGHKFFKITSDSSKHINHSPDTPFPKKQHVSNTF